MKQRKVSYRESRLVRQAAFTLSIAVTLSFAQEPVSPQIDSNQDVESWTGGTIADALTQSASGATIPMSHYTVTGSRGAYKGVLVGGNPFLANPKPVTIDAVLIPLIVHLTKSDGTTLLTEDPTAPDSCDPSGISASIRFLFSPVVLPSDLTFNGVSVGNAQYIDGFMRAEFWNATGGSSSYSNTLSWTVGAPVTFPTVPSKYGAVAGTGCNEGIALTESFFKSTMTGSIIPSLEAAGVISPTKFAFFLLKNVITRTNAPPTTGTISAGKHYATGSPLQTWARASYNVVNDVETATHEIGEWMNDPLVTNKAPSWGHIGQISNGCSTLFEVGDPLTGTSVLLKGPLGSYEYHVQQLAFFSWFFNTEYEASLGAGGKFSSNGKFTGPSKNCPPGGTY
jgi:hypothetical protein